MGGGRLSFLDKRGQERDSIDPVAGSVAVFTSGWENIHQVGEVEQLPNGKDIRMSLANFLETQDPKILSPKTLDDFMHFIIFCVAPPTSDYAEKCIEDMDGWLTNRK